MFLDYFSLFLLLLSLTAVFYLIIYIHDLPHKIAKARDHPHEEAIHVACWLSLITLHMMWPIIFTWAVSHKKPKEVPPTPGTPPGAPPSANGEHVTSDLAARLAALEQRLQNIESSTK
jgi:hypothetical protein